MSMTAAFWLAGTAASHSVLAVKDGERLTPLLGQIDAWAEITMLPVTGRLVSFDDLLHQRFLADPGEALRAGTAALDENAADAHGAVLVTDQTISPDGRPLRVLLLDVRAYALRQAACTMVIPYRSAAAPGGFATHRPSVVEFSGFESSLLERLMGAFFAGMESHRGGWPVWTSSVVRDLEALYSAPVAPRLT